MVGMGNEDDNPSLLDPKEGRPGGNVALGLVVPTDDRPKNGELNDPNGFAAFVGTE